MLAAVASGFNCCSQEQTSDDAPQTVSGKCNLGNVYYLALMSEECTLFYHPFTNIKFEENPKRLQKRNMNSHISKSQCNASLPPAPCWAADQGGNILNFYFIRRPFLLRSGGPAPRPGQGRSPLQSWPPETLATAGPLGANTATPGVKMKPAQELCA